MGMYNEVLLTILLILGAILAIVLIVVSIKLIYTVDKVNIILNDVEKKVESVNGLFNLVDRITDGVSSVSDVLVNAIVGLIEKIFTKKDKNEEIIDE